MSAEHVPSARRASNFRYVKPSRRKASQYEEITLHTQWDPRNYAVQGWFNLDRNGRPIWNDDATRLQATDWWEYRDPQAEWFRPFVKRQADVGRAIEQAISGAKRAGLFAGFDRAWLDFLATHYAAYRYAEYGLFLALCQAQREAGSDVVAQPIVFQSIEKDRHAQDIALYGMELETHVPGFSDRGCKQVWLTAPHWQPLRKFVEKLLAARDWGEITVVVNCVFEPLVATLFLRELVLRCAPLNGDSVTPVIVGGAEADREIRRASTTAFIDLLLRQKPSNRETLQTWVTQWHPLAVDAAQALCPLFAHGHRAAQRAEQAYDRVCAEHDAFLHSLGLSLQVRTEVARG